VHVLVLARHAKAEAHTGALNDHERPLALRGRTDARELGATLMAAGFEPDVAYVSDAVRTSQTWELASTAWEVPVVHRRRELYNTTVATLVGLIGGTEPGATNVIVVGHEPTISAAALFLAGPGSSRQAVRRVVSGLPTGMAAVLEFDGEWPGLAARTARLVGVVGRSE
jgi:phosphohistidine phosphatase